MIVGDPAGSTMVTVAVTSAAPVWSTTVIFRSARAGRLVLRARGPRGEEQQREQQEQSSSHCGDQEPFFTKDSGLRAGFTLNLSTVHSSLTLPLALVVMRCGSRTPSTFLYSL